MTMTMGEIHLSYKETPLVSENLITNKIKDAIEAKGFNFHPSAICKALDAEAERQFQDTMLAIIKGITPTAINTVKSEIIKWYNDEEERFEKYKEECLRPVEVVVETKKKKK